MKAKHIIIIAAALSTLTGRTSAQETSVVIANPSPGVGVGVGIGAGVGLAGNIQVERIPGNVVQGRRVFAAKFVAGGTSASSSLPSSSGGAPGPTMTSTCSFSASASATDYGTVISVLNPNTNAVTLTRRAVVAGTPIFTNITQTLPAGAALRLDSGDVGWMLGNPPGFPGAFSTGFVVIESRSALEVVALYTYSSSASTLETQTVIHEECGCCQLPHTCE